MLPAWLLLPLRWGPALLSAAAIFTVSHQSFEPGAVPVPDYIGHLAAYFCFCLTIVWGYSRMGTRALSVRQAGLTWLWSTLYGLTDELHQSFVPLRDASVRDLLVDALGALLAAALCWVILRRIHRGSPA